MTVSAVWCFLLALLALLFLLCGAGAGGLLCDFVVTVTQAAVFLSFCVLTLLLLLLLLQLCCQYALQSTPL
jgi:hypothetical protein